MPKVVIPLAPGDYLTEVGYSVHLLADDRRRRLVRAVINRGYAPVVRRLNATAIRIKNNAPASSQKIRYDMNWLKDKCR